MKRLIVEALEWLCGRLDNLPGFERGEDGWRFYRYACWGCRIGLAQKSCDLDDRWHAGVWT